MRPATSSVPADRGRQGRDRQRQPCALASVTVALLAFGTYLPGVAPTITWSNGGADSGDLATAVLVAGIPHPPGYPTYMLLALAWSWLPFPGDLAHRLALLSLSGSVAAVALTTATILRLARPVPAPTWLGAIGAVYGGLTLAWSPLLWSQATICEVYAPGLLGVALVGILLLGTRPLTERQAALAALIGGFSYGILPQVVLAGPSALGLVLARFGLTGRTLRSLALCAAAAGCGLLTLVYLPIRAAADPLVNWGDPSSPQRFIDVVTAAQYRFVVGLLGPADWLIRLQEGIYQLGQNVTPLGVGLALLAIRPLWSALRAEIVYLILLLVLTLLVRATYPVEGNLVYLIPAAYATSILAGLGLAVLLTLVASRLGARAAGALAAAALTFACWGAVLTAPAVDASDDWTALLTANRLLAEAPPDAVLLSRTDETTFALWYAQAAGQQRPDVAIVDERLIGYAWYREQLARRYPDLGPVIASGPIRGGTSRPRLAILGPPRAARLAPAE